MPRSAALLILVFALVQVFATGNHTPRGSLPPLILFPLSSAGNLLPHLQSQLVNEYYSGAIISLLILPRGFLISIAGDQYTTAAVWGQT